MGKTQITADPGSPLIIITREFDAPRDLVFRAHTEPGLLERWLGPRDHVLRVERYEVRDGGRWRYVDTDATGAEHGFHGVFHGTPSAEHGITQTFEYEGAPGHVSLETAAFEERAGRTLLRIVSTFQSVEARDAMVEGGMERGVHDSHEQLAELLAGLATA